MGNQDIPWDTSSLLYADHMFHGATSFNQDISSWDVTNVVDMNQMFLEATSFNQDLSLWDVSNVNTMDGMFDEASSLDQALCWDVAAKSTIKIFDESPGCVKRSCCPDCYDYSLFFSHTSTGKTLCA